MSITTAVRRPVLADLVDRPTRSRVFAVDAGLVLAGVAPATDRTKRG
ncbi:hypothetical protein [Agromyces albus]|nr:hypothetical protein [Agromyces albus]